MGTEEESISEEHDVGADNSIVVLPNPKNSGQIAPLDVITRLKEKYCFHVLLDESNAFGVLGTSGGGLTEHYGVLVEKIDIITAAMGHALATDGGFCTGNVRVVDHQLKQTTGSFKIDLQLLEDIADRVLKEDSVFVVASKRSTLNKCRLPTGIRLFVSAGLSESDLLRASDSLKRVAALVLSGHN